MILSFVYEHKFEGERARIEFLTPQKKVRKTRELKLKRILRK